MFEKPRRTNILETEVISRDATGPDGDPYMCWGRKAMQGSLEQSGEAHITKQGPFWEELVPLAWATLKASDKPT